MDVITYNGYEIQATPYQLAASGEWTINLHISADHGNHRRSRQFSAATTFKSRAEAVQHCFIFGRQVIDGQFPDCSVSDL